MKAGWKTVKLGDVARIISGRNQREVESPNGPHPIIGSGGEMGRANETLCPAETTVVGRKGSINRPFFMTEPFWNVDTAFGISADQNAVTPKFLHYFCLSFDFTTLNKGTTIPSLVKSDIAEIPIPLPPLAEQKRIVALLDEAFAGIDAAKAKAEEGLRLARDSFKAQLQSAFSKRGPGWVDRTLEEVSATFGRGKSKHRPRNAPHLYGGKYPFVQTGDIRSAIHTITEYTQTYSDAGLAQSKLWPKGTICITIAANIAETAILGFDACFPDSVIGVVADPKIADVGYIEYVLQSLKARLQSLGKGSAQANINMATFENERFPFPPVAEQRKMVSLLDALSAHVHELASIYEAKEAALDELKSSLLTQAFAGELTA